jgi:hypothetical protein
MGCEHIGRAIPYEWTPGDARRCMACDLIERSRQLVSNAEAFMTAVAARDAEMAAFNREKALLVIQLDAKDAEIARLTGELEEIALATGYGERPEGQSGVHRASGELIASRFREAQRQAENAEAALATAKQRIATLEGALKRIAEDSEAGWAEAAFASLSSTTTEDPAKEDA